MKGKRIAGQGSKWLRRSTRMALYIRDGFACLWCSCGQEDTPHLLAPRAWLRYLRDSGIDTTGIADRVRKHTARKLDRTAARAMLAARS